MIEAGHVIRELIAIAFADHNELSQLRRESCRHCHGEGHAFQWTDAEEFGAAVVRFKRELLELPAEDRAQAEEGKPECLDGFGSIRAVSRIPTARAAGRAARLGGGLRSAQRGADLRADLGSLMDHRSRDLSGCPIARPGRPAAADQSHWSGKAD